MPRSPLSPDELESMRERCASAALAIYLEDGLDAITFRRLADAVGISHTLPYRYFSDKDELLARVRTRCFLAFDTYVRSREASTRPLVIHLGSIAAAYVEFASRNPAEYRLMFSGDQPPADYYPELLAARHKLFDHLVDVIGQYVDAGDLVGDARMLVHALWVSLHGLMSLHVANQLVHGRNLDELARPIIDRLLDVRLSQARAMKKRRAKAPRRRTRSS